MGVIRPSTRVSFQPKAQLGVLYTSSRGSTRDAAHAIAVRLGPHVCGAPVDVAALPGLESLSSCEGFIFGTPTYATGASAQRSGTAWDDVLYSGVLRQLSLLRKPFAVFGCGDAARFPENFADAMGELHDMMIAAGGTPLTASYTPPQGYLMRASRAMRPTQQLLLQQEQYQQHHQQQQQLFVGLPLDHVNQPELTQKRIARWCDVLLEQLQLQHPGALAQQSSAAHISLDADLPVLQQQQQRSWRRNSGCFELPDAPARWPASSPLPGAEYPRGYLFSDRWYACGDGRWARFGDQGFALRAGFREHPVYCFEYSNVLGVHVQQPAGDGPAGCVDVIVDVRMAHGSCESKDTAVSRAVVLRGIESARPDGGNTIADWLLLQQQQKGRTKDGSGEDGNTAVMGLNSVGHALV